MQIVIMIGLSLKTVECYMCNTEDIIVTELDEDNKRIWGKGLKFKIDESNFENKT